MTTKSLRLELETAQISAIYELVQAAKLVGSADKNQDDPTARVLAEVAEGVTKHIRQKMFETPSFLYQDHLDYIADATASVKDKVLDEKVNGLRRDIKKTMSDAVKVFEQFEAKEDKYDQANATNNWAAVGMKRKRHVMLDDEIHEKVKEVESMYKRLREAREGSVEFSVA